MHVEQPRDEWHFDFGLANQGTDEPIPYERAEELMQVIVSWAEQRGYGIGGGFREFTEEEKKPFPLPED